MRRASDSVLSAAVHSTGTTGDVVKDFHSINN